MPSPTFSRALNKKLQRERRLREARRQAAYAQLCAADAEPRTRPHNSRQLVDAKISANIVPHVFFLRHMQARRLSKDNDVFCSASRSVAGRAMNVADTRPRRTLTGERGCET